MGCSLALRERHRGGRSGLDSLTTVWVLVSTGPKPDGQVHQSTTPLESNDHRVEHGSSDAIQPVLLKEDVETSNSGV